MLCSECGAEAEDGARYCSSCGRLLGAKHDAEPRGVASGGEPGLSWAGRGTAQASEGSEPTSAQGPRDLAEFELATFGRRLGGFGIDMAATAGVGFVLMIVASAIFMSATGVTDSNDLTDTEAERLGIIWFAMLIPIWLGSTWWFSSLGWSLGKRAVGLRIIGEDGQRPGFGRGMGRTFGAWLSWLGLGLGFLWAAWDPQQQTWHDKMAGTYVVRADSIGAHHERDTGSSSLH